MSESTESLGQPMQAAAIPGSDISFGQPQSVMAAGTDTRQSAPANNPAIPSETVTPPLQQAPLQQPPQPSAAPTPPSAPVARQGADAGQQAGPANPNLIDDGSERPITDWGKVDLELGDARVDGTLMESYGQLACEVGLTPKQAKALVHWQLDKIAEQQKASLAREEEALLKDWGDRYAANAGEVTRFLNAIARTPGLENVVSEFDRAGALGNAVIVRTLHMLSQLVKEDSTGRIGGRGFVEESAEDGIRDAFARARGLR